MINILNNMNNNKKLVF